MQSTNAATSTSTPPAEQPKELIDLREVLQFIQRYATLIIGSALFAAIVGAGISLIATPKYTATTSILIETRAANIVDVEAVLSGFGSDDKMLQSQIEIIGSNAVAERVIDKHGLWNSPEFLPTPSLINGIIKKVMGAEEKETFTAYGRDPSDLSRRVLSGLDVKLRRNTTVVDVMYEARSPSLAAELANGFANAYLMDQLETKYDATRRVNEWLSIRLAELRERVRKSEQAVEIFRNENNLQVADGATFNEKQIATLNQQLVLARAKTAEAQAKVNQIDKVRKQGGSASSFADAAQSAVITQLRAKASEVARREAELVVKYGKKHPEVVSVRSQLSDFNRQIREELQRIVNTAQNELAVARSRELSISSSLEQLRNVTSSENQALVYLRELTREAEANRTLYESFLNRFKETQESEKMDNITSRILTQATPPVARSYPNKKLFVVLSFLLGLVVGVVISLLLELFDYTLKSHEDVEERLGLPLFATVPMIDQHSSSINKEGGMIAGVWNNLKARLGFKSAQYPANSKARAKLRTLPEGIWEYASQNPFSQYAEAVRVLRSRVRFSNVDNSLKTLLITSALPGEGKSTVALNLAHYAAKTGERVLLIDADMRHPVSTAALAGSTEANLATVLTGEFNIKDAVRKEPNSSLYFLPAPRRNDLWETAELLSSMAMQSLIDAASKTFDLVVIDSPPVLPVIDSRVLSRMVQGTIMVSFWDRTDRFAVERATDLLEKANANILGVVLNNFNSNKAKKYSYQSSYGYDYFKYEAYYG
ncbi:polysaccharide biosynthesis tyrosine autokinase [Pseudovibrio sp. SCP19]|uniref:polysaccharide biosynthesis tyrosine autokinase n=1 Tax=Pseudovibrio sp. SCP19 TaxID=3141374 RepID=UPI0033382EE9